MLEVKIYDAEGNEKATFEEIDFVSYVSGETYGPPALVAPSRERGEYVPPKAEVEDEVLYINTRFVPMWKLVRVTP